MTQLVAGPSQTNVLALAGDTATAIIRIEFSRVFGDTVVLGSEVLWFVTTNQTVTMQVAFSQDGGITYYDRGTIDYLYAGPTYNGVMPAIGQFMRVQLTSTVNATTVTSRFTVR